MIFIFYSAVNCHLNPFAPIGNAKGVYDWNETVANRSYTHEVEYSCPYEGWGFPSNGHNSKKSVCQLDRTWSLQFVEECILLPCPE